MNFRKDYYQILGVTIQSTSGEIKAAYRILAKKYHPDLHPGNPEYEERIKEINEAYGVLSNGDEKFVYDQFKETEKQVASKPRPANQRTYTKTVVVTTIIKTFVKGKIFIKYRGRQDNTATVDVLKETIYNLVITEVRATILAKDIYPEPAKPKEFDAIFSGSKVNLIIPQPVKCKVVDGDKETFYELVIKDLTIPNLTIENSTKDDGDSFGLLQGDFYGYLEEEESHEEQTEVTECFGETGRSEKKTENNVHYYRKEYFNKDCTLYWGNWIPEPVRAQRAAPNQNVHQQGPRAHGGTAGTYRPRAAAKSQPVQSGGCLPEAGNILSILFLLVFLTRAWFLWPFVLVGLLFWLVSARLWSWLFRLVGVLFIFLFIFSLIGFFNPVPVVRKIARDKPEEVKPKRTVVKDTRDTLITYFRSWKDYDGNSYQGKYNVRASAFKQAHQFKNGLDSNSGVENGYDELLYTLKEHDKDKLNGLYQLLDTIRAQHHLTPERFAEAIVSMVQDIPYAAVLPKDCDPGLYADEFIAKYLASVNARCDANEKYGINTPVEFLATQNGDCDTRTLLLYTVLSHYQYDLVLLSSEQYSHSIIGINLPFDGIAYPYQDKKYVVWETTSFVKPGILPNEVSNLDNWRISLKSTP